MVRPGILLYGVYPSIGDAPDDRVRPALDLEVPRRVLQGRAARSLPWAMAPRGRPTTRRGSSPSPWATATATSAALSNVAQVLIRGKSYPQVVGRVCMDQITVNIEWRQRVQRGPGRAASAGRRREHHHASTSRRWAGTIPYEVLTNINKRVPRVYV